MTIKEIAEKLAKYCEKNDYVTAQKELYAENIISIEPDESAGFDKETKGLKNVNEKITKFMSGVEESYGTKVHNTIFAGNSFAFVLDMDIKMKGQERMTMSEICVYTVKDEKIIQEEFFW